VLVRFVPLRVLFVGSGSEKIVVVTKHRIAMLFQKFLATGLVSGAMSGLLKWVLFPHFSINHDELTYLWQADAIRNGRFTIASPISRTPGSFLPWFTYLRNGSYVPKYTPPNAIWFAFARTITGGWAGAVALTMTCASFVVFANFRRWLSPRELRFAIPMLALTPFWVLQSATLLSYMPNLLLVMSALALLQSATDRKAGQLRRESNKSLSAEQSQPPEYIETSWCHHPTWKGRAYVCLAGALVGIAIVGRPVDGACTIFGLGIATVIAIVKKNLTLLAAVKSWFIGLFGFAVPVGLIAIYNKHYTGSAITLPFTKFNPNDTIGFGKRSQIPGEVPLKFTFVKGLIGQLFGLLRYAQFGFGGPVGLAVFFLAIWAYRESSKHLRTTSHTPNTIGTDDLSAGSADSRQIVNRAFLHVYGLIVVVTFVTYTFIWSTYNAYVQWDGSKHLGPFYLFPAVPFVAALLGIHIASVPSRRAKRLVIWCAVGTLLPTAWTLNLIITNTRGSHRVARIIEATPKDSLIVLAESPPYAYIGNIEGEFRNDSVSYDQRLFILGGSTKEAFKGIEETLRGRSRPIYLATPLSSGVVLTPQKLGLGRSLEATLEIDVPPKATALFARVGLGKTVTTYLITTNPVVGSRAVSFVLDADSADVEGSPIVSRAKNFKTRPPLRLIVGVIVDGKEILSDVRMPFIANSLTHRIRVLMPGFVLSSDGEKEGLASGGGRLHTVVKEVSVT
jgi:hypothetical protein